MGRSDWLTVGLKLMGVYFAITGVASLWNLFVAVLATAGQGERLERMTLFGILHPAIYLLAAFFLVCRTHICLAWCGEPGPQGPRY
jgi:hypothetical protein